MDGLQIAIDARLWGAFWTGTSSYLRGITRALADIDATNNYVLVRGGASDDGPTTVATNFSELVLDAPHIADEAWEQIVLPTELSARRVDVLLAPGGVIPVARDFAAIPVVHDLGFLHRPEFYEPGLGDYLGKWVEVACHSGDAVVCNSEFTRRSVVETYSVPADRCEVIYPAPGSQFCATGRVDEAAWLEHAHGVVAPYVLTVSSGGPNKNLAGAVAAVSYVSEQWPELGHRLIVVGTGKAVEEELRRSCAKHGLRDRVRLLARVRPDDLAALYRCADLLFFPSLYEGFGLPPVEAMACGTAVVASDRAALPEVLGDAAALCDPTDHEAMAEAVGRLLLDDGERDELARAGLKHAASFSWHGSAQKLLELIQRVWEAG